jgi:hypothetical protein
MRPATHSDNLRAFQKERIDYFANQIADHVQSFLADCLDEHDTVSATFSLQMLQAAVKDMEPIVWSYFEGKRH